MSPTSSKVLISVASRHSIIHAVLSQVVSSEAEDKYGHCNIWIVSSSLISLGLGAAPLLITSYRLILIKARLGGIAPPDHVLNLQFRRRPPPLLMLISLLYVCAQVCSRYRNRSVSITNRICLSISYPTRWYQGWEAERTAWTSRSTWLWHTKIEAPP